FTCKMKKYSTLVACFFCTVAALAAKPKDFDIKSPKGSISIHVTIDGGVQWSVTQKGEPVILPSKIALHLETGEVMGENTKILSAQVQNISTSFAAID